MRDSLGGEHERGYQNDFGSTTTEEEIGTAGGEASDPQLCLWGSTRVSADKAVAPSLEEFESWLEGL